MRVAGKQRLDSATGEPTAPPRIAPARGPPLWEAAGTEHDPSADPPLQPAPAYAFDQRLSWYPGSRARGARSSREDVVPTATHPQRCREVLVADPWNDPFASTTATGLPPPSAFDKLVGKKMLVAYNSYKMAYHTKQDDLLKPNHLNPDVVRWELHRVWVGEATLKADKRHIHSKRTFYFDGDGWIGVASDEYDVLGKLYRVGFQYVTPSYDVLAPYSDTQGHYDLVAGMYGLNGWTVETGGVRYTAPLPEIQWSADALAGAGIC